MAFSASPEPSRPNFATLLHHVRGCCSLGLVDDVQIAGGQVALPWHTVRAILAARDILPHTLVAELQCHGQVLADDQGLTIIARAS
jgi:hypothetical protein